MISLIAAMSRNRVIGKNNRLPWNLPADMKRFVQITKGKPVIMGRHTYESIGKPLPDRLNIILTRDKDYAKEGCIVVHSVREAVEAARDQKEIMVIGGAAVYEQFLPIAGRMYLTLVDGEFEGDAFFPSFNISEWAEIESERHSADEKNPHDYMFVTLERKSSPSEGGKRVEIRA